MQKTQFYNSFISGHNLGSPSSVKTAIEILQKKDY